MRRSHKWSHTSARCARSQQIPLLHLSNGVQWLPFSMHPVTREATSPFVPHICAAPEAIYLAIKSANPTPSTGRCRDPPLHLPICPMASNGIHCPRTQLPERRRHHLSHTSARCARGYLLGYKGSKPYSFDWPVSRPTTLFAHLPNGVQWHPLSTHTATREATSSFVPHICALRPRLFAWL